VVRLYWRSLPQQLARRTVVVTVCYLVATAALIVLFGRRVPNSALLVAVHLGGAAALIGIQRGASTHRLLAIIRDWHPILLFPLLFKEVEPLAAAFGDWRLTAVIPAIEAQLFAGEPSVYLSSRLNLVPLSEWLHFCYLSYLVMVPGVAAYWYVTGRRLAFHELVLLLAIAMLGSYLFFVLFPVDSPYYRTPRLASPFAGHLFFDLVHAISDRGGARGGAFPSAHVTGAIVLWLVAWRHQRVLALTLAPVTLGLIVATVYGRFHYALDAVAGLVVGTAVVVAFQQWSNWTELRSRFTA
jgi:membrane-associated phospholipid phosphatase